MTNRYNKTTTGHPAAVPSQSKSIIKTFLGESMILLDFKFVCCYYNIFSISFILFFVRYCFSSVNFGPLKSMMPSFFILLSSFDNADRFTHRNCAICSLLILIVTESVPDFA